MDNNDWMKQHHMFSTNTIYSCCFTFLHLVYALLYKFNINNTMGDIVSILAKSFSKLGTKLLMLFERIRYAHRLKNRSIAICSVVIFTTVINKQLDTVWPNLKTTRSPFCCQFTYSLFAKIVFDSFRLLSVH